jgi:predicted enzyme related to lactoylglutathione lyase
MSFAAQTRGGWVAGSEAGHGERGDVRNQIRKWVKTAKAKGIRPMGNSFGTDIIFETPDPAAAARFYVEQLGFTITEETPELVSLSGPHINMYIERGKPLGPVFEVTVKDVEEAKKRLVRNGCTIVKDEPHFPRCYVRDPHGLMYNLTT